MHDTLSGAKVTSPGLAQTLESYLRRLLERIGEQQSQPAAPGKGPGAPQKLPSAALWTGLVLGVLSGVRSLRGVWRSLVWQGYDICDETVYDRLEEEGTTALEQLFAQITQMLLAWLSLLVAQQSWKPLAPFAPAVVALDETTLDPVARKLPILRHLKKGAVELLPGKLAGLFDVRLQLWRRIDYLPNALQNSKVHARAMLEGLAQGTLVLCDLGYFGFEWLDELTLRKMWWVSRLREKTSYTIIHTYSQSEDVFDGLVMLGTRQARARYAVRLVRWRVGVIWYTYLTNVLEPQTLPMAEIARLYARRWDIEIVQTQMTKTNVLTALGGGDHIADLHLFISHHHTINQQLDQLPFLLKGDISESKLDPVAKSFDGLDHACQFIMAPHTRFQLAHLFGHGLLSLLQFLTPSLVLFQVEHIGQVGVGEPFHLLCQADACFAQILSSGLQFLRKPLPSLSTLQCCGNGLWMGEHFTYILPHQVVQLPCRNEARGTFLVAARDNGVALAAASVVRVPRFAAAAGAS